MNTSLWVLFPPPAIAGLRTTPDTALAPVSKVLGSRVLGGCWVKCKALGVAPGGWGSSFQINRVKPPEADI